MEKQIVTLNDNNNILTNEDKLKSMSRDELAHEFALIATWDRQNLNKVRKNMNLVDFMKYWLAQPWEE